MHKKDLIIKIVNFIVPVSKKMVLFESVDYGDNSRALYETMRSRTNNKYKVIWVVADATMCKKQYPDIHFVEKTDFLYRAYYRWVAKYSFYTHNYVGIEGRKDQVRCFLTHGTPIKDSRKIFGNMNFNTDIISTSEEAADLRCQSFEGGYEKIRLLGFPRNDVLFRSNIAREALNLENAKKIVVWMPTFKHHSNGKRNDLSIDRSNDIGLLTDRMFNVVNEVLAESDSYLIVKYHPYQDMCRVPNATYSNIKTLTNNDLISFNLSAYDLLAISDGLITDFSSVYLDYLLIDKPIAFDISDIDVYGKGFLMDNPIEYMPGQKITSENDIIKFLNNVIANLDDYRLEREEMRKRFHKYHDDRSSERVLDFFGLS